MITAIVFVKADVARIPEVAEAIAALDGVSEVYSVTGQIDLIALVRVRDHDDVADVVADRLNKVAGRHRRPRPTSPSGPTPGTTSSRRSRSAWTRPGPPGAGHPGNSGILPRGAGSGTYRGCRSFLGSQESTLAYRVLSPRTRSRSRRLARSSRRGAAPRLGLATPEPRRCRWRHPPGCRRDRSPVTGSRSWRGTG